VRLLCLFVPSWSTYLVLIHLPHPVPSWLVVMVKQNKPSTTDKSSRGKQSSNKVPKETVNQNDSELEPFYPQPPQSGYEPRTADPQGADSSPGASTSVDALATGFVDLSLTGQNPTGSQAAPSSRHTSITSADSVYYTTNTPPQYNDGQASYQGSYSQDSNPDPFATSPYLVTGPAYLNPGYTLDYDPNTADPSAYSQSAGSATSYTEDPTYSSTSSQVYPQQRSSTVSNTGRSDTP
jgi:hypothetical protein